MDERPLKVRTILSLLLTLSCIQKTHCKTIADSNQINTKSLPKIITVQTYKDWSSRLGSNKSTPQSAALIFEESKEVITTDYGSNQKSTPLVIMTTTQNIEPLPTNAQSWQTSNKTSDDNKPVNAHNVAAQVLSRIIHIAPLLALASSGVPRRHTELNRTFYGNEPKKLSEDVNKLRSIDSLNEIDTENVTPYKAERITPSVIAFPTTPSTTTLADLTMPIPESTPTEQPEYAEEDHNHEHDHHYDEESQHPSEDQEDYEEDDDDEEESLRYPVRASFDDVPEGPPRDRESGLPFVMPNIDLNPESLKQKGCRTVVKEVQAIPVENGMSQSMPQSSANNRDVVTPSSGIARSKREADNSRKFTSIIMTKECHFPGDEGASSEEVPQTVPSTLLPSIATTMSDSKRELTYQTPTPPSYDDYDEDFAGLDFRPQLRYQSTDLEDMMEPKSSNDRTSWADKPSFRGNKAKYVPAKDDFGFDDPLFQDFDEGFYNKKNRQTKQKSRSKNKLDVKSSPSRYGFDDEDFGPQPKSSRTKSRGSKPAVYRSQRQRPLQSDKGKARKEGQTKRKPKKVNRSFAFFRTAEPKDKKPNENDFSVSYGTGNFQSFSDSYDSDKDGPRKPGKTRMSDDDDDDD